MKPTARKPAVRRWIDVLEQLPKYGAREDAARLRMLKKLLAN